MHLAPPLEVTPVEFPQDLWRQKTRIHGLSCGVVCVILCLAVLVEHRLVTDTDSQTQGHSIYRTSIASRDKTDNDWQMIKIGLKLKRSCELISKD